MNFSTLASKLGISITTARKNARDGMPINSIAAARKWRSENLRPTQTRSGRRDGNPGSAAPAATSADLIAEKVLSERAARQLRELELAERQGVLINVRQLEPALSALLAAFRTELLALPDKIAEDMLTRHGVTIDPEMVTERVYKAMEQISALDVGHLVGESA